MFKNWFKKKQEKKEVSTERQTLEKGDKILTTEDANVFYKITRDITEKISNGLESSTIPLWIGDLFMHYWNNPVIDDYNNPEWQNQCLYFWFAEEEFPRKSLPRIFDKMDKLYFRIVDNTLECFNGTVIPWFGMPGGGTKFGFGDPQNPTPIKVIKEQEQIEYLEIIELSEENIHILNDRDNYMLLANKNITFDNNIFYLAEKPITLTQAYQIGVVSIAKISKTEDTKL